LNSKSFLSFKRKKERIGRKYMLIDLKKNIKNDAQGNYDLIDQGALKIISGLF
jgi:hypothetical protein